MEDYSLDGFETGRDGGSREFYTTNPPSIRQEYHELIDDMMAGDSAVSPNLVNMSPAKPLDVK